MNTTNPVKLVMAFIILIAFRSQFQEMHHTRIERTKQEENTFNPEKLVLHLLTCYGVSDITANYITAQAAFESGYFNSSIFIENNNPFGMKLARQRITTASGSNRGHACYPSIHDAVKDFVLWMEYAGIPKDISNLEAYVNLLKQKGYFASCDKHYLKTLREILNRSNGYVA
jgi:uncharacterized FlgJ-related protein